MPDLSVLGPGVIVSSQWTTKMVAITEKGGMATIIL